MPFRLCAFLVAALALSACGGSSSSTTPPLNNPNSTVVFVTVGGAPGVGLTVTLSTALNGTTPPANSILQTATTDATGTAIFNLLPATGKLCASVVQSAPGYATSLGKCHSQPFPASLTLAF